MNGEIREKEVRVISADGAQLGIVPTRKALEMAEEQKLDLVEVAPNSKPVVCRIMDYGKYKYEKGKKEKEAKKKQKVVVVKEVKLKPRIDTHDLDVKMKRTANFLEKGYKVKVSLMLFGREKMHADIGIRILEQVVADFKDVATADKKYGGNETQKFVMLSPIKQ